MDTDTKYYVYFLRTGMFVKIGYTNGRIQEEDMKRLTLVSFQVGSKKYTAFARLHHYNGKAVLPHKLMERIAGPIPRGATISIG